jgi:hypothetical protein
MVIHTCNPNYLEGISRRITVQGSPEQKYETLSEKYLKQKRAGGVAQVVELLHSMHKAMSSNPVLANRKTKWTEKACHQP